MISTAKSEEQVIFFSDYITTPEDNYKLSVIESCYRGLLEDGFDTTFITTARSYTRSLTYSILEKIKELLIRIWEKLIILFNSFCTDKLRIFIKYREQVIDRIVKLSDKGETFSFTYYEYTHLYDYPKDFRMELIDTESYLRELRKIQQNKSEAFEFYDMEKFVDEKIIEFGNKVLDVEISPYGNDEIRRTVENECEYLYQGEEITKILTRQNVGKFYDDMIKTKEEKTKLRKIRNDILNYYDKLKKELDRSYKSEFTTTYEFMSSGTEIEMAKESKNIAAFEMQKDRLLNGWITIYKAAFSKKLDILNDKIKLDTSIIGDLFKRTSMFNNIA